MEKEGNVSDILLVAIVLKVQVLLLNTVRTSTVLQQFVKIYLKLNFASGSKHSIFWITDILKNSYS